MDNNIDDTPENDDEDTVVDSGSEESGSDSPGEGWVTTEMTRAQRDEAQKALDEASQAELDKQEEDPMATVMATPDSEAKASTSASSASDEQPSITSTTSIMLEKAGIEDKNTQKWVLIGGGVVLGLCCLCSCIAAIAVGLSGGAGF